MKEQQSKQTLLKLSVEVRDYYSNHGDGSMSLGVRRLPNDFEELKKELKAIKKNNKEMFELLKTVGVLKNVG